MTTLAQGSTPAYIYIRWSKMEQTDGDSERRQLAAIIAWCRQRGFTTDPSRIFADRGASGFAGVHLARGRLGAFLQQVERGVVPQGSVLVVEAFDRISRLPGREARRVLDLLTDNGIRIGIVSADQVLDTKSRNDLVNEIGMTLRLHLAHEESDLKRQRSRANWDRKRAEAVTDGKNATRGGPRWLTFVDGAWVENEHADTVREAFRLLLNEGLGSTLIASRFNGEGRPCLARPGMRTASGGIGARWTSSAVLQIQRSPAAFGAWQPCHAERHLSHKRIEDGNSVVTSYRVSRLRPSAGDLIRGHYHAVMGEADWQQAQRIIDSRRASGGNKGRVVNILAGIIYCAGCGGRLQLAAHRVQRYDRLYCRDAQIGTCDARGGIRLDRVVEPILARARMAVDMAHGRVDPQRLAATTRLAELDRQRTRRQSALDALMNAFSDDAPEALLAQFSRAAKSIASLDADIAEARRKLAEIDARQPVDDSQMWDALVVDYLTGEGAAHDRAVRLLNVALRRVIERIDLVVADRQTEFGTISAGAWRMRTVGGWAETASGWRDWETEVSRLGAAEQFAADPAAPDWLRAYAAETVSELNSRPSGREVADRIEMDQTSVMNRRRK